VQSRLSDRVRKRLTDLLADDRADATRLVTRLRDLGTLESIAPCAAAVRLLAHLEVEEDEAEQLLLRILSHRAGMSERLHRDPGIRVAAVDFLSNVERRLTNPKIVEAAELDETERSAVTDALTGLHNRRSFREALERETRRSRRYGMTLSLLLLDLDGLRAVNEAAGYPAGDLVLARVGRTIRRAVREADVACRHGGDEFAVILPETDRLGAYAVAERIRTGIERGHVLPDEPGIAPITVSGGIACFPEDGRDTGSLLGCADTALGRARDEGRNRVKIHHAERRRDVRYPTRPASSVRLGDARDRGAHPARPINVSRSGLLVETSDRYWPLDRVRVLLAGEEWGTDAAGWLTLGRVARVEPVFQSPGRFRVAIAFDQPVPEECLAAQATVGASAGRGDGR
jgi:diguanylate cyclase (GGDEF)-like protein